MIKYGRNNTEPFLPGNGALGFRTKPQNEGWGYESEILKFKNEKAVDKF